MIAALYVLKDGPYSQVPVDLWCKERDARKFKGPNKVIAHPPCQRWGRYWGGGPMRHGTQNQLLLGDDDGCFAHALWAVRMFGGILEHPEASHAFSFYGLQKPSMRGGWSHPDKYGARVCCVAQGHYGHRAQKLTWLYAKDINFKELIWGKCYGKNLLDEGYHSKEERRKLIRTGIVGRLSSRQRQVTPNEFRDLLIDMTRP